MTKHGWALQRAKTLNQFLNSVLRALRSQVLRDTGVMFGANLVARGLSFLFFILAARWLSVAEYGAVKYATSWAAALCVLTAPFSLAWTRALASEAQQHKSVTWTVTGLQAFMVLLAGTLLVGSALVWADGQLDWSALLVLAGLSIFYAYEGYLKGRFAFSKLASYMIVGNVFQLVVLGALRWHVPKILSPTVILGLYGVAFIVPITVVHGFRHEILMQQRAGYHNALKCILRSTLALAIVHNAHSLMLNLDIVLLERFHSETQVGYYGVAKTLLNLILVLALATFAVLLPTGARAKDRDKREMIQITGLVLTISLTTVVVMVAFAPHIIRLLFSARYEPAIPALRLLMVGGWFYSVLIVLAGQGLGQRRDSAYGRTYIVALAVNIVLNLIWLPSFDLMGGAWAFLISSVAGSLMALAERWRFSRVRRHF